MKLAELSDIRKGIKLDARILVNAKPAKGTYYAYLEAENFTKNVIGKFVAEKELKRLKLYSNSIFLNYGDYLVYKHNNRFKIIRYEQISGQTVPSETLIVISSNYSIVGEFLGYEKNRKYFCEAIEKWLLGNSNASEIEVISNVEVMTDNIREIEGPNFSEQIGIRKPLDSKELPIKIVDKAISLDKLIKRIEHGELILDTEFQRKSGLWDLETKSRFIESLIVSVPVPAFYFDGDDDDKWLVIDGVQRLSTVSTFLKDAFELTALDYLSKDLEGKKFSDLGRAYQRKIEEYQVFAYILQKGTPQSVKYKIFKNINTSALILTPQEIRHAINPNKPAPFLKKIVEMEWFIQYVPMSLKKERMYDRETVLRFIAFQIKPFKDYSPSIVDFLDDAMYDIYDIPEHGLTSYEQDLEDILSTLFKIFGEPCFSRNIMNNTSNYIHNNIIFELLTYGMSKLRPLERTKLISNKEKVKTLIINYFKNPHDNRFWETDYAYSQEGLHNRFEGIERLMNELKKL